MKTVIETPRLVLRQLEDSDFESLLTILSDPKTMEFWPAPLTAEQVRKWVANAKDDYQKIGMGRYAVIEKSSGLLIGDCGFKRYEIASNMENDLGYIIHHAYQGKGYAFEAAKGCLDYARDVLKLDRVVANMESRHERSQRVAEKLGMRKETEFINARNRNLLTSLYVWNRKV